MNNYTRTATACALLFSAIFFLATACDEDDANLPAQRANRILEYKVVNVSGDPVVGSVNDNDSTIMLYLPYYYYLNILMPEITVSEGATVDPESGELIQDMMDYFEHGRDIHYTVTAKDKTTATYHLSIDVQQPAFFVQELSEDAENPAVFTNTVDADPFTIQWSGQTPIFENTEINVNVIRVTLVREDGFTYTFSNNTSHSGIPPQFTEERASYYLPDDPALLPAGLYTVKVRFYSREVTLENPVRIVQG